MPNFKLYDSLEELYAAESEASNTSFKLFDSLEELYAAEKEELAATLTDNTDSAFDSSVDNAQKLFYRGIQTVGDAVGVDAISDFGAEGVEAQEHDLFVGGYQPEYGGTIRENFNEGGFGQALSAAWEKTQENAALTGTALVGGGLAAITAPFSVPLAATITGATLATTGVMGVGEVASEMEDKGVEVNNWLAIVGGVAISALDKVGLGKMFPTGKLAKMTTGELVEAVAKAGYKEKAKLIAKEIGKRTGTEVLTEIPQEGISVLGATIQGAEYSTDELIDRAIDTMVVASAVSSPIATVSTVADVRSGLHSPRPKTLEETTAQMDGATVEAKRAGKMTLAESQAKFQEATIDDVSLEIAISPSKQERLRAKAQARQQEMAQEGQSQAIINSNVPSMFGEFDRTTKPIEQANNTVFASGVPEINPPTSAAGNPFVTIMGKEDGADTEREAKIAALWEKMQSEGTDKANIEQFKEAFPIWSAKNIGNKQANPTLEKARNGGKAANLSESISQIPDGTKGKKQLAKHAKNLDKETDPVKKLNAINGLKKNLSNMLGQESIRTTISEMEVELKEQGYEVPDMVGTKFDEGMKAEVSFVIDESLAPDEAIITKVGTPQVDKDGVMVQAAKITVSIGVNTEAAEVGAPIKNDQLSNQLQALGLNAETAPELAANTTLEPTITPAPIPEAGLGNNVANLEVNTPVTGASKDEPVFSRSPKSSVTSKDDYLKSQLSSKKLKELGIPFDSYNHPTISLRKEIKNKIKSRRGNQPNDELLAAGMNNVHTRLLRRKQQVRNEWIANNPKQYRKETLEGFLARPNSKFWDKSDKRRITEQVDLGEDGEVYRELVSANLKGLVRGLKAKGFTKSHTSNHSGRTSSYYMTSPEGVRYRISNHELPDTPERMSNRSQGLTGRWDDEIIVESDSDISDLIEEMSPDVERAGEPSSETTAVDAPVDRKNMSHSDVLKRVPQLTEAANNLAQGTITKKEYAEVVKKYKPIFKIDEMPDSATNEQMTKALTKDKVERIGVPVKSGEKVGLRLDIPAYKDSGVWIPVVHVKGSGNSFNATARISDVKFLDTKKAALNVATGAKSKSPFATIKGSYVQGTTEENRALAKEAMNSPEWIQVGFDPERHSYFYDRTPDVNGDHNPVASADEVIQIGQLVLAKNPVYANEDEVLFNRKESGNKGEASDTNPAQADGFSTPPKKLQSKTEKKAAEAKNGKPLGDIITTYVNPDTGATLTAAEMVSEIDGRLDLLHELKGCIG